MRREISSFVLQVNSTFKPLMDPFIAKYRSSDHGKASYRWLVVTALSIKIATSLDEKMTRNSPKGVADN